MEAKLSLHFEARSSGPSRKSVSEEITAEFVRVQPFDLLSSQSNHFRKEANLETIEEFFDRGTPLI